MATHDLTVSGPESINSDPTTSSLEIILRALEKIVDCHLPWSLGAAIGSVLRIVDGSNTPREDVANAREFARRALEQADTLVFLASVALYLVHERVEPSSEFDNMSVRDTYV